MDVNSLGWMTEEVRAALAQIVDAEGAALTRNALKRQHTVRRVAWAHVMEHIGEDAFFKREKLLPAAQRDKDLVARSTWYKLRRDEQHGGDQRVTDALLLCIKTLTAFRSTRVERHEAEIADELRIQIADGALDAVTGLRQTALQNRNADGTDASMRLVAMFNPALAAPAMVTKGAPLPVEVKGLDELIDYELARLAASGEGDAVTPSSGTESDSERGTGGGG